MAVGGCTYDRPMAFPLPSTLSPSKVSTFKDCALAFRFSAIDKLPEPSSVPAVKGTLVHRALELLFATPPPARTRDAAAEHLATAFVELQADPEFVSLDLDSAAAEAFLADATIIDRLELDADGELVVTDYKTGRVPSQQQELSRLGGVQFYAWLCEQVFGKRPARVQLMYLGPNPQVIIATPTDQSIRGLERKVAAIWNAVERACEREDFRPRQSHLCNWCSFQEYCPAFGGDPSLAPAALHAAAEAVAS